MRVPLAIDTHDEEKIDPRLIKTSGSKGEIWALSLFIVPTDVLIIFMISILESLVLTEDGRISSALGVIIVFLVNILIIYTSLRVKSDNKSDDVITISILPLILVSFLLDGLIELDLGGLFFLFMHFLFVFLFVRVISGSKTALLLNFVLDVLILSIIILVAVAIGTALSHNS